MDHIQKIQINRVKNSVMVIHSKYDASHDFAHVMRVVNNAREIIKSFNVNSLYIPNPFIIELACLLHDVNDVKYKDIDSPSAESILNAAGVRDTDTVRILKIIEGISWRSGVTFSDTDIDGQIAQDADRLDAVGAVGIARAFTYGGMKQRSMTDTIEHFYQKLLQIKGSMNTSHGMEMAKERHMRMESFLNDFIINEANGVI